MDVTRCRRTVNLAEGAGFEPAIRSPAYTLSRRAPSTTRPPLPHSRVRLVLLPAMRIYAKGAHYNAASSRRKRAPTAIADKVGGGSSREQASGGGPAGVNLFAARDGKVDRDGRMARASTQGKNA